MDTLQRYLQITKKLVYVELKTYNLSYLKKNFSDQREMSPQNAAARRNIALLLPPPINASLNRDTAPSLKKEMSWYDF